MKIQELVWTPASEPDHNIRYDHVVAETSFGQITITWKSWKPYPDYTVDFPFEWSKKWFDIAHVGFDDLHEAKTFAQSCWNDAIISTLDLLHTNY